MKSPLHAHLEINSERLRRDIKTLASIGADAGGGVTRPAFSAADLKARQWLYRELQALALPARIDSVANVVATYGENAKSRIVIGSHLDSVPGGGALDGALGVLVALECLRALKEAGIKPCHPVELVAFSDEEGRFGGMLGSRAYAGLLTHDDLNKAQDKDGNRLVEVMAASGFNPDLYQQAFRDQDTLFCYLELHIEQGPVLENRGVGIGIVEGIVGLRKWYVSFAGDARHAGTTPMALRRDALQGFATFASRLNQLTEDQGSSVTVATVGHLTVSPGAPNVVPGNVEFSLEARDLDEGVLDRLTEVYCAEIAAAAKRHQLSWQMQQVSRIKPAHCHPDLRQILTDQASQAGLKSINLASGAAHDAQILAQRVPAAMLFVPSCGGVSHSREESTRWEDIEAGANVFLRTVALLATDDSRRLGTL